MLASGGLAELPGGVFFSVPSVAAFFSGTFSGTSICATIESCVCFDTSRREQLASPALTARRSRPAAVAGRPPTAPHPLSRRALCLRSAPARSSCASAAPTNSPTYRPSWNNPWAAARRRAAFPYCQSGAPAEGRRPRWRPWREPRRRQTPAVFSLWPGRYRSAQNSGD